MSTRKLMTAVASVFLWMPALGYGQAPASVLPATAPAGQQLSAKVAQVKGMVSVRDDENQPWRMAREGMVLPVGGECRTGPKSAITLTIEPEQTITLDRLGTVKILEAMKTNGKLKTDLGMKYGRVRYSVEAAGLEHESTIRSPSNALAVRGSNVELFDDGITSGAIVYKGLGNARNRNGSATQLGSGPNNSYSDSPIVLDITDLSVAQHNYDNTVPYYSTYSLNADEQIAVSNNNVVGGLVTGFYAFRPPDFYGNVHDIVLPPDNPSPVTGRLTFNLSWSGDQASGATTPNLNLFINSPLGEHLTPHATAYRDPKVTGGGVISPDDHSARGTLGLETATWRPDIPLGHYTFGARYLGSGDPATLTLSVLLDGKPINPSYTDTLTQYDRKVTFTLDLQSIPAGSNTLSQKKPSAKRPATVAVQHNAVPLPAPKVNQAAVKPRGR